MAPAFVLIILMPFLVFSCSRGEDDVTVEIEEDPSVRVFVPTDEWQTVEEDEVIPAGLHVRMNLETGHKEAKLLEPDGENTDTDTSLDENIKDTRRLHHYGKSDRVGIINKKTKVFTKADILSHLESNNDVSDDNNIYLLSQSTNNKEDNVHIPRHGNDYENQVFENSQFSGKFITKEQELMLQHFDVLTNSSSRDEDVINSLEELEYYVHHYENGKFLVSVGGLSLIINLLNNSNVKIQTMAADVLGAAAQSNPQVKKQAVLFGCLWPLVQSLSPHKHEELQRKALFALASILRQNPTAMEQFEGLNGFKELTVGLMGRSARFQLKALVLMTDLINEVNDDNKGSLLGMELMESVVGGTVWCEVASRLIYSDDIDQSQKGLEAMLAFIKMCDFSSQITRLRSLEASWSQECSDDLCYHFLDIIQRLLQVIHKVKQEL